MKLNPPITVQTLDASIIAQGTDANAASERQASAKNGDEFARVLDSVSDKSSSSNTKPASSRPSNTRPSSTETQSKVSSHKPETVSHDDSDDHEDVKAPSQSTSKTDKVRSASTTKAKASSKTDDTAAAKTDDGSTPAAAASTDAAATTADTAAAAVQVKVAAASLAAGLAITTPIVPLVTPVPAASAAATADASANAALAPLPTVTDPLAATTGTDPLASPTAGTVLPGATTGTVTDNTGLLTGMTPVADPNAPADPTASTDPTDPTTNAPVPTAPTTPVASTDTPTVDASMILDSLQQTVATAAASGTMSTAVTGSGSADKAGVTALGDVTPKNVLDLISTTQRPSTDPLQNNASAQVKSAATPPPVEPYKQIMNVVAPLKQLGDGDYSMTLRLHPAHLGSVDVAVSLNNGQISMQLSSDSSASRQMLRENMNQLRQSLESSGLSTGSLDVGSGNAGQQNGRQAANNNGSNRPTAGDFVPLADEDFFARLATVASAPRNSDGHIDTRV